MTRIREEDLLCYIITYSERRPPLSCVVGRRYLVTQNCLLNSMKLWHPTLNSPWRSWHSSCQSVLYVRLIAESQYIEFTYDQNGVIRSKVKVIGVQSVKIVFGTYLREKCIDSRRARTGMTSIPAARFIQCASENACFSRNGRQYSKW